MKDFWGFIKDIGWGGFKGLTSMLGTAMVVGFAMTLFPSLSFLPKTFVMFIVLPWVLGH